MTGIRLQRLRRDFAGFAAVADVNLDVEDGEFLTILGPSGSGKTTLLALIAGLLQPTSGHIVIGGRDVTGSPPQERNIGLVFQSYALFPHMTVEQNVAFPLAVRKWPKARSQQAVEAMLKLMRLDGLGGRRPLQLSGGQQQRVALARALVFQPNILLLDEPLGALDRKLREELQVELKQLQRRVGITTLLVTHDQEEALSMGDRVMVLDKGAVQQLDTPQTAYLRPANRFVAEFLGTANIIQLPDGRRGIVRPENVRLMERDAPDSLAGVVQEAIYLGQSMRYYVSLPCGGSFICTAPFTGHSLKPGDPAAVGWSAADVWPVDL